MSLGQLLMTVLVVLAAGLGFFYWWGHYYHPANAVSAAPITGQYEIIEADNGKTFEYPETSRFTVFLDQTKYDVGALDCGPDGILGSISNVPVVAPPLAAVRFEVTKGGTCVLRTGDFSVKIIGDPNL